MRQIVTNCHECHLEGSSMPAMFATGDGDFYCDPCREASGLDADSLFTIPQYLESKGLNPPPARPLPKAPKVKRAKSETIHCAAPEEAPQPKETVQEIQTMPRKSDVDIDALLAARAKGMSAGQLADEFAISKAAVYALLSRHGAPRAARMSAPAKPAPKPDAPADAAPPPRNAIAITLALDDAQLNRWWARLPIEARGELFASFHHGAEA